ncbi:MAG: hypothetical protein HKO85_00015 [Xanthomonadales bacterium]|nr:hypothetical protein [Gammaproteobacteria bacterium]MBT8049916.1 hypothetical protein [Gammaproteobacteria bacterium]MBT8055659.1 hypothetical protein [Gammaproteobacteria bacterium]NNJ79802.1 hypothetical protein [Xanthomonadales bacterium]NNL03639.1 hypothetical protein [Xanthomonadales bacterium]
MRKILTIAFFVALLLAVRSWEKRDIVHPPGVLVTESPVQRVLAEPRPIAIDDFVLSPRASFRIRARVLSREDYHLGDEADLSPMDLALGWGVMSDQAVLDRIRITQGGRWYFTRYELPAPIPDGQIIRHSGNVHLIPANDWVRDRIRDVRRGDVLQLRGFLVDVDRSDGFRWRTSLTREDSGGGSCEIFYLEQIFVEPRP